jgi:hypothetical protein
LKERPGIVRVFTVLLALLTGAQSIAQEPYLYFRGSQTLVLFRPRRISTDRTADIRVGVTYMRSEEAKLGDVDCKKWIWHSEVWPHAGGPDAQIDLDTETWVGPDGKVLKIVAKSQRYKTLHIAEAVRKDDQTMEVTTTVNHQNKQTSIITPRGGCQMFDNAFKGLLFNKNARPEDSIEYFQLDALTGTSVKYKARVKNVRVSAMFGDKRIEAKSLEITGPSGSMIAYVSNDGVLIQVDFPKDVKLLPATFVPQVRGPGPR